MSSVLTNSACEAYRRCEEYYRLRYELCLRKNHVQEGEALSVGSLAHLGLEVFLKEGIDASLAMLQKKLDDAYVLGPENRTSQDVAKATAIVRAASLRWPEGGTGLVEKVISGDVVNPETGAKSKSFTFKGKVDAVLGTTLIDWKTVGKPHEYVTKKTIGFQAELYANALRAMDFNISSVQYRLIARPSLKLGKKEDAKVYEERCFEWIVNSPDHILEHEVFLNPVRLEEARHWLWDTAKRILDARANSRWLRNPGACFQWNRQCDYLGLCEASCQGGNVSTLIEMNYEKLKSPHTELEE